MTLQDFEQTNNMCEWISKERFWFENKKVKFWYRYVLTKHVYQPGWNADIWKTRYSILMLVDKESIHPSLQETYPDFMFHTFLLKETEKRGKFSEEELEKVLNSALKLKIENKIKDMKYHRINGILNGWEKNK